LVDQTSPNYCAEACFDFILSKGIIMTLIAICFLVVICFMLVFGCFKKFDQLKGDLVANKELDVRI